MTASSDNTIMTSCITIAYIKIVTLYLKIVTLSHNVSLYLSLLLYFISRIHNDLTIIFLKCVIISQNV